MAIYPRKLSSLPPSMYASTKVNLKTKFSWVGQCISFDPGQKSPYQYLSMQVTAADNELGTLPNPQQVKLGSALRRMMMGYLQPQDWIRVMGKAKLDAQTGEMLWKASEIVKISTQQASELTRKAYEQRASSPAIKSATTEHSESTRILVCQESSCRQRGSQAVGDAIAQAIITHGKSADIRLQPTGCMKQCKVGPHVVLAPSRQANQPRSATKYTRVAPAKARQIANQIIENL